MTLRKNFALPIRSAMVWAAFVFGANLIPANLAEAGALSAFDGSWRGGGTLVLDTGKTERIRCRMKVNVTLGGSRAKQTMQCASTGRDVIINASISANGGIVSGTWHESGIDAEGHLSGRIKGQTLHLRMSGPDVSTSLTATAARGRQSLRFSGRLGPIRKLSIDLRRRGE